MKKLFFSAVALTIFSLNAKAEEKKENNKFNQGTDPCVEWALDTMENYEVAMGCEYDPIDAGYVLLYLSSLC